MEEESDSHLWITDLDKYDHGNYGVFFHCIREHDNAPFGLKRISLERIGEFDSCFSFCVLYS